MRRPTWTPDTPANPSAGSARSTAAPWGSRMPALGRISTRALTRSAPVSSRRSIGALARRAGGRVRPIQPRLERLARDPLVRLDVARARARDHGVGGRRGGRALVPAGGGGPVAYVLLVEAGLPAARLMGVGRPVARGVGGRHRVGHEQLPCPVPPP